MFHYSANDTERLTAVLIWSVREVFFGLISMKIYQCQITIICLSVIVNSQTEFFINQISNVVVHKNRSIHHKVHVNVEFS